MSEDDTTSKGKPNAWTDEAKYQFLLRVIAQYKDDGKSINWKIFHMPGRTTKSLQNMWTKVNQQLAELEIGGGGDEAGTETPTKKATTPRKPRGKKADAAAVTTTTAASNGDDSDEVIQKTPKKRGRPAGTPSKTKKTKVVDADNSPTVKDEVADDDLTIEAKPTLDTDMHEA